MFGTPSTVLPLPRYANSSNPKSLPSFTQASLAISWLGTIISIFFLPFIIWRLITPSAVNVLPVPVPFATSIPGLSLEYRRFSIAFISSCCSEYNKGSVSAMLASSAALIGVSSFTCCCRFNLSVASSEDFRSVPFSLEVFPEISLPCLSRTGTLPPPVPSLRSCPESLVPRCEASDVF